MRAVLIITVCGIWLCGCASRRPIPHLSDTQCREIADAANTLAHKGRPLPDAVKRLKPVEVYYDLGNVVIALYKDDREERGFYYKPNISSHRREANGPDWTWKTGARVRRSLWRVR